MAFLGIAVGLACFLPWYQPSEPVRVPDWAPARFAAALGFAIALLCLLEAQGLWPSVARRFAPARCTATLLAVALLGIEVWSFAHVSAVRARFPVLVVNWGVGLWLASLGSTLILVIGLTALAPRRLE
jgi:hypothetical protein